MDETNSVVGINEHALDKECISLPTNFLKFAHLAAEARRDVIEAKAELDLVEADLAKHVRDNPGAYGLEKVTETAIASTVLRSPKYQTALKAVHKAQHEAEMHSAVVSALEHKKRALTLLVELHGMSYYSDPKISKRGKEAVETMTKRHVRRRDLLED